LSPSSGSKSKPTKKPAQAGGEPEKAITTNIPVNGKARRMEGNVGEYAVVGSVTLGGSVGIFPEPHIVNECHLVLHYHIFVR
jgi:hypothetical protein